MIIIIVIIIIRIYRMLTAFDRVVWKVYIEALDLSIGFLLFKYRTVSGSSDVSPPLLSNSLGDWGDLGIIVWTEDCLGGLDIPISLDIPITPISLSAEV